MIAPPSAAHVWLAVGHTDMRCCMNGLALQVQQSLQRDPHAGDLYVFRSKRGDLVKILWHDGLGMSLYAKRLERGRFIWPTPTDGALHVGRSRRRKPLAAAGANATMAMDAGDSRADERQIDMVVGMHDGLILRR